MTKQTKQTKQKPKRATSSKPSRKPKAAASNKAPATRAKRKRNDSLLFHDACMLFDQMGPEELRKLGEDIKTNRLRTAIAV